MSPSVWARSVGRAIGVGLAVALGWVVWAQVRKSWAAMAGFELRVSFGELAAAVGLGIGSCVFEARAWQLALNGTLGRKEVGLTDSVAMVNTSGLLKYLPGGVWSYGAQVMWLAKRGFSGASVVYVNIVCILCSILVSTLIGSAYLIHYVVRALWAWPLFVLVVAGHVLVLISVPRLLTGALVLLRKLTGREIAVTPFSPKLMTELGGLYVLSWALVGAAGFSCGRGVGLPVTSGDAFAITAATSIGWVVGYIYALAPGGMGVREGVMYLMLSKVSSAQVSLILPLASRLLSLSLDVILGAFGLAIGLRRGLFKRAE